MSDSFALAQKRILARRAAQESALAAHNAEITSERTQQLTRLPSNLRTVVLQSLNLWDRVQSPFGTSPAFRVGQVDAELLDEALLDLLKKQFGEGLKLYGAHLKDDWDAEILLLLRTVLWKLSIWDHGASYGASLQGLRYIDARGDADGLNRKEATKWQRSIYGLVMVGGRYAWTRWKGFLSAREGGYEEPSDTVKKLSKLSGMLSASHDIASFLSFAVFLGSGKYRTLTDRILRLRLVPVSNQTSREVSFEFLNRQLVWHAFTEFLLFLLPLVGITRWKRWITRAWKKLVGAVVKLRTGVSTTDDEDEDLQKGGELAFLPERTCAICYQDQNPSGGQSEQDVIAGSAAASAGANSGIIGSAMTDITNPYAANPCGCIYCFVCLAQRIEAEEGEGWVCLRCGEIVKECAPWDGDVLVEGTAPVQRHHERKSSEGVKSEASSKHNKPRRRKSVMFDLDDDDDDSKTNASEDMNGSSLSAVDPMPIEDSLEWSKVNGDTDDYEAIETDEE